MMLEKFIDLYITDYFTNSDEHKSFEMQLLIVGDNRISFESKRQIFHFLAEKYDKEWYTSYKSVKYSVVKKDVVVMNKDLVYIIEQRNVLAHRILDTSPEALADDKGIYFLTFKNELAEIYFTEKTFIELKVMIGNITKHLSKKFKK